MNDQAVRFRLGIFVLAALILLAVLIVLFGEAPTIFRASNRYIVSFPNAPDVGPGTPVRRSGVKIGEVESVKLDDETGMVHIGIRVDRQYTIRKNDEPTLVSGLLGGDTSIDFVASELDPGEVPDTSPVDPGTTLQGKAQLDARAAMQKATQLVPPAQQALIDIQKAFARFEKMAPLTEETLKEFRDLAKASREAVPTLKQTSEQVLELTKEVRKLVPDAQKTNDEIQLAVKNWGRVGERVDVLLQTNEQKLVKALDQLELTIRRVSEVFNEENQKNLSEILRNVRGGSRQLESLTRNTDKLLQEGQKTVERVNESITRADNILKNLEEVTKPMAERSANILKNLDEATLELNRAMADVRVLMRNVGQGEGTVQKFLSDPTLYNRLDEAACALNRLLPRVDRILRDAEIFADKIARHPEALGIGGAIRPSNGLKNLPSVPIYQPNSSIHQPIILPHETWRPATGGQND